MVNTCEPAQRPSRRIKLKWLTSLSQKARKPEVDLTVPPRGQQCFPVDSRYLTPRDFRSGTWQPRIFSRKGRRTVRGADGGAGSGCRKKRRPSLNGESQESWRRFDHPAERPLLWPVQSLVPTMVVSQRLPGCIRQPGSIKGSAFEVLEPYAGKLARTVLRGAGDP